MERGRVRERGREARGEREGKKGGGERERGDKCKFWGEEGFQETYYS